MTHAQSSSGTSNAQIRLYDRLSELGIKAPTVDYPAHQSIDEGKALRGSMAGTFTKNLLLKDTLIIDFDDVAVNSSTEQDE